MHNEITPSICPQKGNKSIKWLTLLPELAISALILFGTVNDVFALIAFLCGILYLVKGDVVSRVSFLLFTLSFATIFKISAGTSLFTFWELFFVLIYLYEKQWKATKLEFSTFLFIGVLVINQLLHGNFAVTTTIKFFAYIMIIVITCEFDSDDDDNKRYFISYIIGFIVSSFIKWLNFPLFRIYQFVEMKQERVGGSFVTRFSGLYGDPNYYSVNLIIALTLIILIYGKKKITILEAVTLTVPTVFFISLTGSKSGFFMLAFVCVVFIIQCFARKKYILGLLSIGAAIALGYQVVSGKYEIFNVVLSRLASNSGGITSGRMNDKWMVFLKYFTDHPLVVVFGRSIAYYDLNGIVAHNTYIDMIYEMGIIGSVWLMRILQRSRMRFHIYKRNILNYSVLLVVLMMYFFLSELQYFDSPFHIIIALIVFNMDFTSTYRFEKG